MKPTDRRWRPRRPAEFDRRSWRQVLKRTVPGLNDIYDLIDRAAALTFYSVLSVFPALLAFVSILGLIGDSATEPMLENLRDFTPGPGRDIATSVVETLQESQGNAGIFTLIGIAVALFAASGYIGAFMRAANAMYDVEEGRPIWKTIPLQLAVTVLMLLLLAITILAVVITGDLADRAGALFGIGDAGVLIWEIAKWPALVLLVMVMLTILSSTLPNVHPPGLHWITPGSLLAVVLWTVASAGFALYVANFGSFDRTYGALAGVIISLVWLWLTNIAVLLGVRFNAELDRERSIVADHPSDELPPIEPRQPAAEHDPS